MWRHLFSTLGVTAGMLMSRALAAEPVPDAPPTYSLSWVRGEGAESCPAGRALAAEVERRLGRKVFDAAAERSFEVQVARVGDRFRSDVYVRDAVGVAVGHRSLQGDEPGCSALLAATALAIALVIDPEAAAREPSATATFDSLPPPPAPPPAPLPPPAPSPKPVVVTRVVRMAPPPRPLVTVSGRGLLTFGLVPRVSPGVELSFGARLGQQWGVAGAATYVAPQNATLGIGSFEVGLTRARLLGTYDLARSEALRWVIASGPSVGALHLAVREPAPATGPGDYLALGLDAATSIQVSVTKGFFVELGLAGHVPLRVQAFRARGQGHEVWRQPILAGWGSLGVGAQFP